MKLVIFLLFGVTTGFAADETCAGRCQDGFDPTKKCQCDTMCKYYGSCCVDFDTTCRTKTRGDVFDFPEEDLNATVTPTSGMNKTTARPTPMPDTTTAASTVSPDPEAATCSGHSFDAFLQLKNGSIYAFRGEYVFELDERSVLQGYPKLIKDVWGVSGPIDAAFTRINCQGKTYIFKGNKYWRFDDAVLDEDYPRDISVGFEKIPDDIDAAFAIPAPGHHGKEKVYFFKGDRYYQYEFKHQPSHEECIQMINSSPSILFKSYTNLYCDYDWENLFTLLFQGIEGHHKGPRFIAKDWVGIKPPIDAAMVGRLYMSSKPSPSPSPSTHAAVLHSSRRPLRRRKHKGRGSRLSRSLFWEDFGLDYEESNKVYANKRNAWKWFHSLALQNRSRLEVYGPDHNRYFEAEKRAKDQKKGRSRRPSPHDYSYDLIDYADPDVVQEKAMPVQNVYFFKKDKYYRVDLQTKRIDYANPPYPRSITKYWLGCKEKDLAEKR